MCEPTPPKHTHTKTQPDSESEYSFCSLRKKCPGIKKNAAFHVKSAASLSAEIRVRLRPKKSSREFAQIARVCAETRASKRRKDHPGIL